MSRSSSNLSKQKMSMAPDALIELFELDFSIMQENMEHFQDISNVNFGSSVYRFCAMINGTNPIYWQGHGYQPLPIETEGFEKTGDGRLPRPKLRIANPDGILSLIVKLNKDFANCTVTRKRTYAKFLDEDNFLNRNTNSDKNAFGTPDPDSHFPDDIFFINRKILEKNDILEFELVSALELEDAYVPARPILSSYCSFTYRCDIGCGYKGLPLQTIDGKPLIKGYAERLGLDEAVVAEIDYNLNFEDINEWSRYGKGGGNEGYNLNDIVKIVGKNTQNPYRLAPSVFVCIQSHEFAKDHHPFFDKSYWLKDDCNKTLDACRVRFSDIGNPWNKMNLTKEGLRFGGFPGTENFPIE